MGNNPPVPAPNAGDIEANQQPNINGRNENNSANRTNARKNKKKVHTIKNQSNVRKETIKLVSNLTIINIFTSDQT